MHIDCPRYDMPGAHLLGMSHCKICQTCWMAYRQESLEWPFKHL